MVAGLGALIETPGLKSFIGSLRISNISQTEHPPKLNIVPYKSLRTVSPVAYDIFLLG